jgi:hypothetical protein
MPKTILLLLLFVLSCNPIRKATDKAEEEHYALYKQKALFVYRVRNNKVMLTNPPHTRYYYLKGKQYVRKWQVGDTMVIDSNLIDFYNLRFMRM